MTTQFTPVVNQPSLYINGLLITWLSNTTFSIGTGFCRDSSDAIDISVSSTLTVNAAINGVNGLDTGSLANSTWYYMLIISDSSGYNAPAGLLSTSYTAPTLPAGYDSFRLLGATKTNGSAQLLRIWQVTSNGNTRRFYWDVLPAFLTSGNATNFTAVSAAVGIPPINNINGLFLSGYIPASAGNTYGLRVAGSAGGGWGFTGPVAAQNIVTEHSLVFVLSSGNAALEYKVQSGSDALNLLVRGFDLPC